MPHINKCLHIIDDGDMCLIMSKVFISLNSRNNVFRTEALLQLNVHHTSVDARPCGDSHRECLTYALDGFDGNCMPHAHTGTKVRVGNPLRHNSLHEGTHHGVTARIPTRGNHRDHAMSPCYLAQRTTKRDNIRMNIKAVNRANTLG